MTISISGAELARQEQAADVDDLAAEAAADRARAAHRGRRLDNLVDRIATALFQDSPYLAIDDTARGNLFHVLADDIYGNQCIDIPVRRGAR